MEMQTTACIKEGLQVLIEFGHPKPTSFMVDNCAGEIKALEESFEGTS